MYYQFIYKFLLQAIFLLHKDYEICCTVAQKGRCIQTNILFSRCLFFKKLLKITELLIYIILRFNCLTGVFLVLCCHWSENAWKMRKYIPLLLKIKSWVTEIAKRSYGGSIKLIEVLNRAHGGYVRMYM